VEYGGLVQKTGHLLVILKPRIGICASGAVSPSCICVENNDTTTGYYYQPNCFLNGHNYSYISSPGISYAAAKAAAAAMPGGWVNNLITSYIETHLIQVSVPVHYY